MMNDLIEKLSNLRSQHNCFDENERDVYHTLSEAIKVISERPEPCEDAVSRKAVYEAMVEKGQRSRRYRLGETWELNGAEIRETLDTVPSVTPKPEPCEDDKGCSNCMYSGRPTYKSPCSECHDNSQWEMKPISRSHENGTECEDAVSRKDVIDLFKRGAEIIAKAKGISVEDMPHNGLDALMNLPSVTPKHKTWKWIEYDSDDDKYDVIKCPCCKHTFTVDAYHWTDIGFVKGDFKFCPNCNADMRGKQE